MDKLYIISDSEIHGSTLGFKLGLTNHQVKIITSMEQLDNVPDGIVFVHDKFHPENSVQMTEILLGKNCINFRDYEYICSILEGLYADWSSVNQLFDSFKNETSTQQGIDQLRNKLNYRGLKSENGFDMAIARHPKGWFYYIPRSNKATVLYNLLLAKIRSVNATRP